MIKNDPTMIKLFKDYVDSCSQDTAIHISELRARAQQKIQDVNAINSPTKQEIDGLIKRLNKGTK